MSIARFNSEAGNRKFDLGRNEDGKVSAFAREFPGTIGL
jgi:hypothetical protein